MRNIDEKTFSAILERIEALKNELSLLEEEVKALPVLPVSEPIEEPVEEPDESADLPEEATVAAGAAAEFRPHSAAAQREWTRPGPDGVTAIVDLKDSEAMTGMRRTGRLASISFSNATLRFLRSLAPT